jgi:hypothetical protein
MEDNFVNLFANLYEECVIDRMVARLETCVHRHTRRYIALRIMGRFINVIHDNDYQTVFIMLQNLDNVNVNNADLVNAGVLNFHEMIRILVDRSRIDQRINQILELVCDQCEALDP